MKNITREINHLLLEKDVARKPVSEIVLSQEDFNTFKEECTLKGLSELEVDSASVAYKNIKIVVEKDYPGPPKLRP